VKPATEVESRCIMCSSDFRFVCTNVGSGLAGENAGKAESAPGPAACAGLRYSSVAPGQGLARSWGTFV